MLDDFIDSLDNWYCVYKHVFPNSKVYIGMTKSYPPSRWGKHGEGYKCNSEMYDAILKYGWDNVEHHIVERNLTYEEALELETKLTLECKSYDLNFGYNDFIGAKRGKRSLKKQSATQTGMKKGCSEKQRVQLEQLHLSMRGRSRKKEVELKDAI